MERLPIDVSFGTQRLNLTGMIEWKSVGNALKKAAIAWLVTWGLGSLLLLIPIIHWAIPPVLLLFGPIVGGLVYLQGKRQVQSLDADATCPNCGQRLHIHEEDVAPPIFGMCSNCKAGYEVHVPKKEMRQ